MQHCQTSNNIGVSLPVAMQQVVWGWWPDWLLRHVSTELEPPKLRGRLANDNGTDVWCHTCVNAYMSLTRGPWAFYIQAVNEAHTKAAVQMTFPGAFGLNRTKFKISQLVTSDQLVSEPGIWARWHICLIGLRTVNIVYIHCLCCKHCVHTVHREMHTLLDMIIEETPALEASCIASKTK